MRNPIPNQKNVNTLLSVENQKTVKSKPKPVVRERVQCEMDDMNDKINDLDVKLNLLLEKLNSREEVKKKENQREK